MSIGTVYLTWRIGWTGTGTLALVLWAGWLPMRVDWLSLTILWFPAIALNLAAGSALARGYVLRCRLPHHGACRSRQRASSRCRRARLLPERAPAFVQPVG